MYNIYIYIYSFIVWSVLVLTKPCSTLGALFQNQPLKSVELQHRTASRNTQSGKLKWPNSSPRMTETSWSFHVFQKVNMP